MLELVVSKSGRDLVSLPLESKTFRIGRAGTNDLSLPDQTVSRHQCQISLTEDQARLMDTSGKGTRVDGKLCKHANLRSGSRIELGSLIVTLNKSSKNITDTTLVSGSTDTFACTNSVPEELALVGKLGDHQLRIPLQGKHISLGSDSGNQVVLQDGFVSAFHSRIFKKAGSWYVTDLDSTNGTYINNIRVNEARLDLNIVLSIGRVRLRVEPQKPDLHRSKPHGMLSEDPAMKQVFEIIQRAAPTDQTVLITGESGSGKELVAKAIHRMSRRATSPLITLNCSAITKDLMESELFGHEKGAFTGAQARRKGLFEEADSGTLFLDEIGELAQDVQAKLLRVLENGEMRRVGSNQVTQVDVRLMSATHRFLPEMVQQDKFREDLYYRICVIEIPIPPLRKRPQDIPLLARHFLEEATRDIHPCKLSDQALEKLSQYRYPGNVRELKHIITRAAILCSTDNISVEHLVFSPPTLADRVAESNLYGKGKTLVQVEIDTIRQALAAHDANLSAAAKVLGISRSSLTRKIERHSIPVKAFEL